jgi:hypothetical protein
MPPVAFEPQTSELEETKAIPHLDGTANVIGLWILRVGHKTFSVLKLIKINSKAESDIGRTDRAKLINSFTLTAKYRLAQRSRLLFPNN